MNLLAGGTGFVGGHVVEYLFQQGEMSKGIFRKGSHLKILDTSGVQLIEADLLDHHSLHEAMEGVDVVYNLVSPMPGTDSDFMKTNTEGVQNLLDAAVESKVKVFVHLSTIEVHGFRPDIPDASAPFAPSNDYQRSKAEAERVLQEFSRRNQAPRVAIVRAAKAVGSRDETLVTPLLRMLRTGKVVVPSAGTMSFTHPRDIAQGMFLAANGAIPSGRAFLLKSFDSTTEELAAGIVKATGAKAEVKKQGRLSSSTLPNYTTEQVRASTRIGEQPGWKELGYAPKYDLKSTCEEIALWFKKEPWTAESA